MHGGDGDGLFADIVMNGGSGRLVIESGPGQEDFGGRSVGRERLVSAIGSTGLQGVAPHGQPVRDLAHALDDLGRA